ncbi:MAG: hypothetical protein KC492_04230, partial [Myxococcales bacterium]|nr:hypothetical protein [Myxococcales bacterium]
NNPVNVLLGPSDRLYVADFDNGLIRKVTTSGDVTTFVQASSFARPFGLTFLSGGDLLVQTDYNSTFGSGGALWRVDSSGSATLQVDDSGRARGLATLSDGRVVMSFFLEQRIGIFDPTSKVITPLAGSDSAQSGLVNDTGTAARFNTPYAVAVLSGDEILVADRDNNVIRKVTLAGVVSTFAGDGSAATTDGVLASAAFNAPQGLTVDGSGNVYVSETGGNVLRKISGGQVTTIAGDGTQGWMDSSTPLTAEFYGMEGISVSSDGSTLYVADGNRGDDSGNHRVRVVHLQ